MLMRQTNNRKEQDMTKTYEYAGKQVDLATRWEITTLERTKAEAEAWVYFHQTEMDTRIKRVDAMRALIANEETVRGNLVIQHDALWKIEGTHDERAILWDRVEAIHGMIEALHAKIHKCMNEHDAAWTARDEYAAKVREADDAIAALLAG